MVSFPAEPPRPGVVRVQVESPFGLSITKLVNGGAVSNPSVTGATVGARTLNDCVMVSFAGTWSALPFGWEVKNFTVCVPTVTGVAGKQRPASPYGYVAVDQHSHAL